MSVTNRLERHEKGEPKEAAQLTAKTNKQISEALSKNDRSITHRLKYTLDELLAECDPNAPLLRIDGWDEMTPVGKEILN